MICSRIDAGTSWQINYLENSMDINPFVLKTVDASRDGIYAVGMLISGGPDDEQEVLTYRRDPGSGRASFGIFASPESALATHQRMMPMRLEWTTDEGADDLTALQTS
ncbi:hypothetical protein [Actinophytocola sediminis]